MKQILQKLSRYHDSSFEKFILWLIYNQQVNGFLRVKEYLSLSRLHKLDNILVIADVNIGDAVMIQTAIEALRYYFPDAEIDYMYNSIVGDILAANPAISHSCPIFKSSTDLQNRKNVLKINDLLTDHHYNLILNFSPVIQSKIFRKARCPVITPLNLVLRVLNAHKDSKKQVCPTVLLNISVIWSFICPQKSDRINPDSNSRAPLFFWINPL
ncbi:MAG: hypothetical protein U5R06_16575 [candidate division KSB1 bacterium]|nr:hypothetical protein [candidate division KSB1 bacterium]